MTRTVAEVDGGLVPASLACAARFRKEETRHEEEHDVARPVAARQPRRQDVEEAPDRYQAECRRIPLQFMWLRMIRQRGHHGKAPVAAGLHAGIAKRGKAEGEKAVQDDVYAGAV